MKRLSFVLPLAALGLLFSGCQKLHDLTNGSEHHPENVSLPDDFTLTGTTRANDQIVEPVQVAGRIIIVEIKKTGANNFRTLNKYEFELHANGGGALGGVWLGREMFPTFDADGKLIYLVITQNPAAPTGSEYRIRSIRAA